MDSSWDDIRLFLAVAEAGSVSGASRRLRVGQPTVSRRLAALEYRLGASLFQRSARGVTPTVAGERLVGPARKMAEWAGELGRAADRAEVSPVGLVRVTAAPGVAADLVAPFASQLAAKLPGLRIEVLTALHRVDLARGEADLSLRIRGPVEPELMTLHALSFESAAFAARSLLARLPRRPRMAEVPWIAWAPPYDRLPPNPMLESKIPGFTPAFASDNFLVNVAAAEAGVGAIVLPCLRHRHARPTNLVPLRLDLGAAAGGTLQLVCARSAYDVPRIRLVADGLAAELARLTAIGAPR